MILYPLAPLLRLRIFRQDKAMRAVQKCERELVTAKLALREAKDRHKQFLEWLPKEEERRYQAIMETEMSLDDVEEFKSGLLAIRARETRYLDAILKAKHQVKQCETAVKLAKAHLLEAQKGTMKIETHKEKWLEIVKLDALRAEELEMEDFTPRKSPFPVE